MNFSTKHIDESAYLAIKGHRYKVRRLSEFAGEWLFPFSEKLERDRKQYWSGNPMVNVHRWVSVRSIMKRELKTSTLYRRPIRRVKVNTGEMLVGQKYYYINDSNNIIPQEWGKSPMHQERFDAGRAFLSQMEASKARTAMQA